jgi:Tfp pilus assembly protein PilO
MKGLLNKLNKLELDKKKILFISLACLIAIYLDFTFLIKAQSKGIGKITQKITQVKKDIDTLARDLLMMRQSQLKEKEARGIKFKKIIPEEDLPSLLQYISNIANKHSVKIMQMKQEVKAKDDKVAQLGKNVFINLDLFSTYHNLGLFINELENGKIYLAVEAIKISAEANAYFQHKINLVLKTYVKK